MKRIERDKLIKELEMVSAGLSPREWIEQSSCFVFQDGMVMTFNDEVACRIPTQLDNITGAVVAARLMGILEKIDDATLDVEVNSKGELQFKGKRKRFGLTMDSEIFLPIDRVEEAGKWLDVDPAFADALNRVQRCVSTDESKFFLTCVHVTPDFIEACDNLQIMRFKLPTGLKKSLLVRGSAISQITTLGMDKLCATKSWLHFKNADGLILSCRSYSEDYPDLTPLLKMQGTDIELPVPLKEVGDRAAVFASDKVADPIVTVRIKDNRCRVKGEGITGWYEEVKALKYEGPDIEFVIDCNLLRYVVENYRQALINPTKLKAKGGTWQYITVLSQPVPDDPDAK